MSSAKAVVAAVVAVAAVGVAVWAWWRSAQSGTPTKHAKARKDDGRHKLSEKKRKKQHKDDEKRLRDKKKTKTRRSDSDDSVDDDVKADDVAASMSPAIVVSPAVEVEQPSTDASPAAAVEQQAPAAASTPVAAVEQPTVVREDSAPIDDEQPRAVREDSAVIDNHFTVDNLSVDPRPDENVPATLSASFVSDVSSASGAYFDAVDAGAPSNCRLGAVLYALGSVPQVQEAIAKRRQEGVDVYGRVADVRAAETADAHEQAIERLEESLKQHSGSRFADRHRCDCFDVAQFILDDLSQAGPKKSNNSKKKKGKGKKGDDADEVPPLPTSAFSCTTVNVVDDEDDLAKLLSVPSAPPCLVVGVRYNSSVAQLTYAADNVIFGSTPSYHLTAAVWDNPSDAEQTHVATRPSAGQPWTLYGAASTEPTDTAALGARPSLLIYRAAST